MILKVANTFDLFAGLWYLTWKIKKKEKKGKINKILISEWWSQPGLICLVTETEVVGGWKLELGSLMINSTFITSVDVGYCWPIRVEWFCTSKTLTFIYFFLIKFENNIYIYTKYVCGCSWLEVWGLGAPAP